MSAAVPNYFRFVFIAVLFAVASVSSAEVTLESLLQETREVRALEAEQNRAREQAFLQNRDQRSQALAEAIRARDQQRALSDSLSRQFDENEQTLTQMQADLELKVGNLGEMFGVVRQVAGDTAALMKDSMISAEYSDRTEQMQALAQSRSLPSIESLERLWFEMQREMTASGLVNSFSGQVIKPDGREASQTIYRVGPFTAVSNGLYLNYLPESNKFAELSRQPSARFRAVAEDLSGSGEGFRAAVIDPTRGSLLAVLVQRPGMAETIEYGGVVGYVILTLAGIGLLLAMAKLFRLYAISRAVSKQQRQIDRPLDTNPLGRVLKVYHDHPDLDHENLQLQLNEAVLKEIPRLEAGLPALKILAAVGPLLGLLGTVTGMIITFQQITLFGTGDPKLMAGGISQALVTTVMGLVMAIPLLLLHSFLNSRSRDLVHLLEEETAGIIAEQAEHKRKPS